MVVHHDRLKLCKDDEQPGWLKKLRNKILNANEMTSEVTANISENDDIHQYDLSPLFNNNDLETEQEHQITSLDGDASDFLMHSLSQNDGPLWSNSDSLQGLDVNPSTCKIMYRIRIILFLHTCIYTVPEYLF